MEIKMYNLTVASIESNFDRFGKCEMCVCENDWIYKFKETQLGKPKVIKYIHVDSKKY